MDNHNDLAIATLSAVRMEAAPHIDGDLLEKAYAIQLRHQFNDDHVQSLAAMERLIDDAVNDLQADEDRS